MSRGGATNSPAAVYALTKYVDWMKKYAPKEATGMTFGEAGPVPAQGQIAQQIFWYTAFTADMTKAGPAGGQCRRHAEVAHGAGAERPVLEAGHAERLPGRRLVDILQDHDAEPQGRGLAVRAVRRPQDGVAEEVDRRPDASSATATSVTSTSPQNADKYGGLIEFYRSPARVAWTPTGTNVPDYPKLAQLWWKNVAVAVTGEKTPQAAMDNLAEEMDQVMARLERAGMAQLRAQAQPEGRPGEVAARQGRAVEEAGEREAEGRDHRLRQAAVGVEMTGK